METNSNSNAPGKSTMAFVGAATMNVAEENSVDVCVGHRKVDDNLSSTYHPDWQSTSAEEIPVFMETMISTAEPIKMEMATHVKLPPKMEHNTLERDTTDGTAADTDNSSSEFPDVPIIEQSKLERDTTEETADADSSSSSSPAPTAVIPRSRHAWMRCRTEQEARLFECYDHLKNAKSPELVLITGTGGTGKTELARCLRDPVERDSGYFITGKFDQFQRREPYVAFVSAFTELTNLILSRGESEINRLKKAINDAVGDEASVLTEMIPALERILGKSDEFGVAGKTDAIQRFIFVFRMFVRAVCSPEHPVVLVVEDLQHADPCSLDLLGDVSANKRNSGLVLVGTCDSTCVSPDSYFAATLREMEDTRSVVITNIMVGNFNEREVREVVSHELHLDYHDARMATLAQIAYQQTDGIPFQLMEFLQFLQDSELLFFDDTVGSWIFDDQKTASVLEDRVKTISDDRPTFCFSGDNLRLLSPKTREMLQVAACLGHRFNQDVLEYVFDHPVDDMLEEAVRRHSLVVDEGRGGYAFADDCVQRAAYHLIPLEGIELFHLEIGRRIWRKLDSESLDQYIFVILSQINIGRSLIKREKERIALATLCLHAAKKAAKSSTFRTALVYLNLGIQLLGERSWRDEYDLTLAIYNAAAEMELCVGTMDNIEKHLGAVFKNARCLYPDKIQAYATKIYALGIMGKELESVEIGVSVLEQLGESFPVRLCRQRFMHEMKIVRSSLKGKSNVQLMRLPTIEDEEKLASLQILTLIFSRSLMVKPKLVPFISLKLMRITLKYGMSAFAAAGFCSYGMLCISSRGDVDEAFRYGELALEVLDRFKAKEYTARVYAAFYGVIWGWKRPIAGAMQPLLKGYRIGLQTGDIEFSNLCRHLYTLTSFQAGTPLDILLKEHSVFQDSCHHSDFGPTMCLGMLQSIKHYMGLTPDPLASKGDVLDFDEHLKYCEDNDLIVAAHAIRCNRMELAYVFNEYEQASSMAASVANHLWLMPPTTEVVDIVFLQAMIALAMAREKKDYRKNVGVANGAIKMAKQWGRASPHNFMGKLFLMEAEMASVLGQNEKAYEKYTCAMALTGDSGFTFTHAVACERTARHLHALGEHCHAMMYFDKACTSYESWGGKAKVDRLRTEMERLVKKKEMSLRPMRECCDEEHLE